jgi:hypothetical protein
MIRLDKFIRTKNSLTSEADCIYSIELSKPYSTSNAKLKRRIDAIRWSAVEPLFITSLEYRQRGNSLNSFGLKIPYI